MSTEARCPVCDRAVGPNVPGSTCGLCGWPWYLPLRAGSVTAGRRQDFETRLQAARRDLGRREEQDLDARLGDVIRHLIPGAASTVIEISVVGVTTTTVRLDDSVSPRVSDGGCASWTDLLPMLSRSDQARERELADGEGLGDVAIVALLRDHLPPIPDGPVLVICAPASWRVLDEAATAFAGRPRAAVLRLFRAGAGAVRERLTELAARAPLRCAYQLMTATVDRQTGATALRPRELFPIGAEPGTEASLTMQRLPGDTADTTLAIFAFPGGVVRPAAAPFALYSVALPAEPVVKLRAVLDGPGRVRVVQPAGAEAHAGSWEQVRRQMPGRVRMAVAPVDLLCAIDLAGTMDAVRQRRALIRDLIRLLGMERRDGPGLRIGLVTCTDHLFGRRPGRSERAPVTRVLPLGSADKALDWLDKAPSAEVTYQPAAPVEDLLHEALPLLAASRRGGRVPLLVTVAGRRPHPHSQLSDGRLPCPHGYMWQDLIRRLTHQVGARCAMVTDATPSGAEAAEWRELGRAGQHTLADATARQLAEDLGLLLPPGDRIPIPLADE